MNSTDGSEVKGWMNSTTDPKGALADADAVKSAGDINITLTNDITVAEPSNNMGDEYFFDFTDARFAGKTITIDGVGRTIKIDNKDLFFLSLKDCTVILKNITIDGGSMERSGSFIYVSQPTDGKSSELVIEEGTTIQNCKNSSGSGGGIWSSGKVTMNDTATIRDCTAGCGGGIENYGTVTMNGDATIRDCTAGCGGGIYVEDNGKVRMNDTATISGCTASFSGGGIENYGTVTMNGGKIIGCTAATNGDAIYNGGTLNLPPKEFGFLTITLTTNCYKQAGIYDGTQQCNHNSDPEDVMGYEGISNGSGTINENPNRKIVFVDSESNSTVGFAYGNKPVVPQSPTEDEKISVPNSVLARLGYEFAGGLSYIKDSAATEINVTGSKFTLDDDMIASAKNGVITVKVKYNKLYTVQYICDNKVVGTMSGCSAGTNLNTIINKTFSNITLDGNQTLDVAAGDADLKAKGYTFSNFTYGNGQTYTASTNWDNLKGSAVDGVITVILNYTGGNAATGTASDTVKYVADRHMILDKKSKLTNYSGVNLPVSGLRKVPGPKNIIFDFRGQTIHHNDPNVPFIKTLPGQRITICNLNMDGSGCK